MSNEELIKELNALAENWCTSDYSPSGGLNADYDEGCHRTSNGCGDELKELLKKFERTNKPYLCPECETCDWRLQ